MAEPESSPPGPSPLDALAHRFRLGPRSGRRLTSLLLLLTVSVAAGFVISPGLFSQQIPALTEEHLGKPFRANSPAGFKAGRDYEIIHQAMTEQRRLEARGAVRPVYDLSPGVLLEIRASVDTAFLEMRKRLAAKEAQEVVPEAGKAPPRKLVLAPEDREHFQELLFGRKDAALDPDDFQALTTARFSEPVAQATMALVERAYGFAEPTP